MTVKVLRTVINSIKENILRSVNKPDFVIRPVQAMEVAASDTNEERVEDIVRSKNNTRYINRNLKRQWEELSKEEGESPEKRPTENPVQRIKRKKMALLLGYCGADYYGMQRNPGVKTIEEDLMRALWESKYIPEDDFNNQQNAHFQRSSRTDKGVSAARQIVSLKLPLDVDIEEINKRLPDCIRVFGLKRVTNSFNSKVKCDARTYIYTLPTFTFVSKIKTDEERKAYRITPEKIEEVNSLLGLYKGTKTYHNFTEKKYFHDPSALRYMMHFIIEKIFIDKDMEFAVLQVKGQSFMLHQIRKMIGLVIAVIRGHTDKETMQRAFTKEKIIIPTAPGLGLVLDMVHFERYNARFKQSHESLTWEEQEEIVEKFKQDFIFPTIVKEEVENNSMGVWLEEKLARHSYEVSDLNSEESDEIVENSDIKEEINDDKDLNSEILKEGTIDDCQRDSVDRIL